MFFRKQKKIEELEKELSTVKKVAENLARELSNYTIRYAGIETFKVDLYASSMEPIDVSKERIARKMTKLIIDNMDLKVCTDMRKFERRIRGEIDIIKRG